MSINTAIDNFVKDLNGLLEPDEIVKIILNNKMSPKKIPLLIKENYITKLKGIYAKNLSAFKNDLPKYQKELNKKIKDTLEKSAFVKRIPSVPGFKSKVIDSIANLFSELVVSFIAGNSFGKIKSDYLYLLGL